jgi:hypothetical protein
MRRRIVGRVSTKYHFGSAKKHKDAVKERKRNGATKGLALRPRVLERLCASGEGGAGLERLDEQERNQTKGKGWQKRRRKSCAKKISRKTCPLSKELLTLHQGHDVLRTEIRITRKNPCRFRLFNKAVKLCEAFAGTLRHFGEYGKENGTGGVGVERQVAWKSKAKAYFARLLEENRVFVSFLPPFLNRLSSVDLDI